MFTKTHAKWYIVPLYAIVINFPYSNKFIL